MQRKPWRKTAGNKIGGFHGEVGCFYMAVSAAAAVAVAVGETAVSRWN